MLKEALQWIVESQKQPIFKEFQGVTFTDQKLSELKVTERHAQAICLSTLKSLVDFIKTDLDRKDCHYFLHIVSPTEITMLSQLDSERGRERLVHVVAELPRFNFDSYYDVETFNIAMQSKFLHSEDKELLLSFTANVVDEEVVNYGDDGVSQKATVKTGIVSKNEVIVPNPVVLKPYRTFVEVEQPCSPFIFRVKKNREIECAIFEADGGKWKLDAIMNIKKYLENELEGVDKIHIMA